MSEMTSRLSSLYTQTYTHTYRKNLTKASANHIHLNSVTPQMCASLMYVTQMVYFQNLTHLSRTLKLSTSQEPVSTKTPNLA